MPPNSLTVVGVATLLIIGSSVMSPLPSKPCSYFVGAEHTNENYMESSARLSDHNPGDINPNFVELHQFYIVVDHYCIFSPS
jgi:hypothetical protein